MSQNRQKDNKPNLPSGWDLLVGPWAQGFQEPGLSEHSPTCSGQSSGSSEPVNSVSEKCWGQWVHHSFLTLLQISKRLNSLLESRRYVSQGCFSFLRCARSTVCDSPPEGVGYVIHCRKNKDNPKSTTLQHLQLIPCLLTPMGKEGLAGGASYLPS